MSGGETRKTSGAAFENRTSHYRIPLLTEEEARRALEKAGVPTVISSLNISRALANSDLLIKIATQPTSLLMTQAEIEPRLRELIILRTAWNNACEYEWTQHYHFARALGVSDDEIMAVKNWQSSDLFDEDATAVLELSDTLAKGNSVDDDVWGSLVSALGGEMLALEAAAIAGAWTMVAYVLKAARIPLEEGQPVWPPDGTKPQNARAAGS
ncbi:MAG: hypothetical protein C4318_06440 [Acidimicrobiia bacterium]